MRSLKGWKSVRGFSLIELMVVVAIIAILIGLMLPAIQRIRISARRMESTNNVKQMALAINSFAAEHGFLPPTVGWDNKADKAVEGGGNGTVFFLILPYMDQDNFYHKFYGQLMSYPDTGPVPVGVAAYRANRFPLTTGLGKFPKQFMSPLDKSSAPASFNNYTWSYVYLTTVTSYLANQDLLDKRLSVEKVTNGASNTTLLTEGVQSCGGNVWDPLNYDDGGDAITYHYVTNGQDYSFLGGNYGGGAFQISGGYKGGRINNWAVGTEAWDGTKLISTVAMKDYTDPNNPKDVVLDIQDSGLNGTSNYGRSNRYPGQIPAFHKVDPYYEPWSNFRSSSSSDVYYYSDPNKPGSWLPPVSSNLKTNIQITPLTNPMRATFQDGRSPFVNPALATRNPAPVPNCLWFGAQAHYGNLIVAMLDGSVHSVSSSVTADSWNASISPFTNGVPVGPDFFDE